MLFSKKHPEIYFVHQSKTLNCGDLECCPFLYYYNYFRKFNTDVICIEDTNKLKKDTFKRYCYNWWRGTIRLFGCLER